MGYLVAGIGVLVALNTAIHTWQIFVIRDLRDRVMRLETFRMKAVG